MGAYSSWAMLALTHHVIIRAAALDVGIANFSNYAVLGDDVVINHDIVASRYLELMGNLGVAINLSKTLTSDEVMEFAKRLFTVNNDLSPIGAGAILAVMRKPIMIGSLLRELSSKSETDISTSFHTLVQSLPSKQWEAMFQALWTIYGVKGLRDTTRQLESKLLSWITYGRSIDPFLFQYALHNGVRTAVITRHRQAINLALDNEQSFYNFCWKSCVSSGFVLGPMEALSLLISPFFWLYLESVIRTTVHAQDMENFLHQVKQNHDGTYELLEYSPVAGASIRWDIAKATEFGKFVNDISREIWRSYDEMILIHGADGSNIY